LAQIVLSSIKQHVGHRDDQAANAVTCFENTIELLEELCTQCFGGGASAFRFGPGTRLPSSRQS
jgi:hypothetical protein